MSRVFWDSMLFIYLVEDDPTYMPIVRSLLGRCFQRGDHLYTSHLSIAETLVGIAPRSDKENRFLSVIEEVDFTLVGFEARAAESFRAIRRDFGLKQPDALNLACAATLPTDIYLTNDGQLLKQRIHIPGIQFIADFKNAPL